MILLLTKPASFGAESMANGRLLCAVLQLVTARQRPPQDCNLKGNAIDLLDGEKLFVESCLLVVVLATVWAWRYRLRKDREERAAGIGRYRVLESAKVSN